MPLRFQFVLTLALAGALSIGWVWFESTQEAAGSKGGKSRSSGATRVLVEPISLKKDRLVVRAVGTGVALNSAAIHPSVDGEVIEVKFKSEQRVKKGAVLVRLDDQHQRLAVRLAEVALRKAKRDVARLRKLAKSGHTSRISLDTAQTGLESATVRYAQAKANLSDRAITAPFSGVIGLTDISIGDRVTDETMIATLDERSTLLVDFNLAEDHAVQIRVGDRITVKPSTSPGRRIIGTVSAMGSRIDKTSRSLRIRAKIPNSDNAIRPGTSFEVELAFTGRAFPSVAEIAVLWSRDGAYLWRANTGKAEKVFVKLVRRDRGRMLIDGALEAGDLVVVEGVQGLRAGQKLDPRPVGDTTAEVRPDAKSKKGKRKGKRK